MARSTVLATIAAWGSVLVAAIVFWYWQRTRRRRSPALVATTSQSQMSLYSLSGHRIDVVESSAQCEEIMASKSPEMLEVLGLDCEWVSEPGNRGGRGRGEEQRESRRGNIIRREGGEKGRGGGIGRGEREGEGEGGEGQRRRERGGEGMHPVALLQLAFLDDHCVLVRLCKTGALPPSLSTLLQDNKRLKYGVGIDVDAQRLLKAFGVRVRGCVDLRHIATTCGLRGGHGLRALAGSLLGVELDKSWRLRCSDWESQQLSQQQVVYAASDVAVTLDILTELVLIRMNQLEHSHREEIPEAGGGVEMRGRILLDSQTAHSVLLSLCAPVVDLPFHQPKTHSRPQEQGTSQTVVPKREMSSRCVRQRPLYDNCRLLAPDGTLLSTVDHRKIQWYLSRQLGSLVSETPPTLQLNFEPAGKPGRDRDYYTEEKRNVCVVCGSDRDCIRKSIVPHEYRRLFPAELKEHVSHDVLLLCLPCHQLASAHCDRLKSLLAQEYSAPLSSSTNSRFTQDHRLSRVKNGARALVKGKGIPEGRRKELMAAVAEFLRCAPEDVTPDMIQEAAEIDTRLQNSEFSPHAELVMRAVREGGRPGLLEFQRRWRQHFLDTMNPRFLPELWSVDHNPHQLYIASGDRAAPLECAITLHTRVSIVV